MSTPIDQEDRLDQTALCHMVNFFKINNHQNVVVLGTTGERLSLSAEEEVCIIQSTVREGLNVVVGTGCNCTNKTVSRTQQAKDLGANGALVIIPYYSRPPFRGIVSHFEAVAQVGLPVVVYHHPLRTGISLTTEELKILSKIEGVAAIKEASGDLAFAKELIETVGIPVLCGDDNLTLKMIKMGAKGTISVVSNVIPVEWTDMVNSALKGDWNKAEAIESQFKPLIKALGLEVNPIGIKYAQSLMGLCKPYLRLPLCEPMLETKAAIESAMASTCKAKSFTLQQGSVAG